MKQVPKKPKILTEKTKRKKKKKREELLTPLGIKEFFLEGSITINRRTCKGVECKLCIDVCPTNALYWKLGEIGITEDLCVYCGACVLSCIVDDCIKIVRKRATGEMENFSKPREFMALQHVINVKRRHGKIQEAFPKAEDYLKRYNKKKNKGRKNFSDNRSWRL